MGDPAIKENRGNNRYRTLENKEFILSKVMEGQLLKNIVKSIGCNIDTLADWRLHDPSFESEFMQARVIGLDILAESLLEIADQYEDSGIARVKSENIKWFLSKVAGAKYGDRLDLNVTTTIDLSEALKQAALRSRQVFELPSYTLNEATAQQAVVPVEIQSATNMELLEDLL